MTSNRGGVDEEIEIANPEVLRGEKGCPKLLSERPGFGSSRMAEKRALPWEWATAQWVMHCMHPTHGSG